MSRTIRLLALGSLVLLSGGLAYADDELPTFRPGLWDTRRSVETTGASQPRTTEARKCSAPSEDVSNNVAALKARGCTFSPILHNGRRYTWSSTCPAGEDTVHMQSVLTVQSEDLYRVVLEARQGSVATRTITVGRRIGDCDEPSAPHKPPLPRVLRPDTQQ